MSNESKFPGYLSYPPYNLQTATAFHHHHHQQQQHQQQLTQSAAIPAHFYLSTMQVFPGSMSHIVKEEPKDEHHNDEGNNDSGVSPSHYASSESNPSIGSRSSSHGGSRPSSGNGSMQSPLNDQHQHHHQIAAYDFSSSQPMTEAPAALDLRASPTSAYAGKFEFKASPASGGQDFDYGNSPPSATAADFDCEASPTSSSAAEFDYRPSLPASSASEFVDFAAAAAAAAAAATTPTALASPKESIESLKQRGKTDTLATQKVKVRRANPTLADDETRNEVACPICQFRSRKKKDIADHFLTHCSLPEDGSEEENDRRFQIQKRIISQLEQVGKPKKSKKSQKNKGQTSDVSMEADSVDYSQNTDSNDGSQIDWANEQLIEVYTPSFHANGSVKIIRCKQCPSIFICKVTFWKHMHDSHLDKEKAMKCPKCPFATQLKHHMEYHLNNHSGWKPFKCKLCDYVCVSKSMLSSHMKSHSDVHQFRCATCGYTTKYLHSLKMHLKSKPGHVQDVVLNSDGTQNPYCIIDVFGKKRGPRSKLKSVSSPATQLVPPAQQSPEQFMATSPNSSAMDTSCSPPSNPLSPYNQATFNLMLAYSNLNYSAPTPGATAPLVPFSDPQEMARLNEKLRAHMAQEYMANILRSQQHQQESLRLKNIAELVAPEMNSEPESDGPVDLRSSEESSLPSPAQQQQIQQQVTPMSRPPLARPANRRKGLAIKLSKRTVQADSDSETEDTQKKIKHGSPPPATVAPLSPPLAYNPQQSSATPNHTPEILNMTCPICPYPIPSNLFILHMSAHDPQSPLRCNKCGEVSNDGLAFYNHISLRGIDHGK